MPQLPDTPQLPLDFDAPFSDGGKTAVVKPKSNVLNFAENLFRRRSSKPVHVIDDVDSVLDEVLSNAKRLNW